MGVDEPDRVLLIVPVSLVRDREEDVGFHHLGLSLNPDVVDVFDEFVRQVKKIPFVYLVLLCGFPSGPYLLTVVRNEMVQIPDEVVQRFDQAVNPGRIDAGENGGI